MLCMYEALLDLVPEWEIRREACKEKERKSGEGGGRERNERSKR